MNNLLSQSHKRQLTAGLYTILLENRPSSDEQLAYIPMIGKALSIDNETRKDIANKVLLIHKK